MVRVGINGFGSIGRRFFRQTLKDPDIQVVAVNDIGDIQVSAHLLKYDSNYGVLEEEVRTEGQTLWVGDRSVRFFQEEDPAKIPWHEVGVDIVIESTGRFTEKEKAEVHRTKGGAKKVIISAPAKGEDLTVVLGVNEDMYRPEDHHIISNASCTTNCLAPVVKVLDDAFGVEWGLMTTVHAYTNDQRVLDLPHKDWRRARAAGLNIIPTTTGAARAVGKVLPHLNGKLNGTSLRVPVSVVSIVDLVAETRKPVTVETVNEAFREAARGPLKGILAVTDEELVSADFKGNPHSAIVDLPLTMTMGEHRVKVFAWYDNEWGYAARLVDLCRYLARRGL
ncbi:MAG: type I glyceraldehyde-3-phosphate dehydrogenase [Clostridiales bacterium]|nr:type I glyceraldehyde-3-phosphate dehydrogenase [Clostridiales bacterium]